MVSVDAEVGLIVPCSVEYVVLVAVIGGEVGSVVPSSIE